MEVHRSTTGPGKGILGVISGKATLRPLELRIRDIRTDFETVLLSEVDDVHPGLGGTIAETIYGNMGGGLSPPA